MVEADNIDKKQVTMLSVVGQALANSFRKAWPAFLGMFLATIAAVLLELAPPLLIRRIIDSNLNVGRLNGLPLVATLYFVALIGTSIVNFIQVFVNRYIGQNMILQLRYFMAEHLSKLPMSYYNRTPVGDTISRLTSDVETVSAVVSPAGRGGGGGGGGFNNLPTNLFKIAGVLIAMFAISPRLALMVLVSAPVVYFVSGYFRKNTLRVQTQVRKTVSGINIFLQETFSGMRIIKAYGKEDEYGDRFQKPLEANLKAVNNAAVYDAYFPCVMQVIRAVVIAVVIWFGARTSVTETLAISIGSLAAMADLVTRFFTPIDAITGDFQTLQQAIAGLRRIVELLREKPEEKWGTQPVPVRISALANHPAVEVRGIDFSYRKGEPILASVNLNVPQGKRVAIVGRTGAGKTTLLNLMAGLYRADRGTVSILGYDPHQIEAKDRRRLLGIVPQNVHIFEGTIRENITLRDDTIPMPDIEKAAGVVGLHDFITGLAKGYDTVLGVEGTKLSRGQGQLLSLARAIVSDPPILLLDEPTSGVDAVTEAEIIKAFRQVSQNRTIVTISHRLSGILDAEEVHIMGSGRIVESGRPGDLAGKEGWYSVYRQLENAGWKLE
jgi:ATP-binding cassette, subfamily B, multidrug efflux pump